MVARASRPDDDDMRRTRLERVVAAGRRLADPDDPIGREVRACLVRTSGLSPEGIELILREHMETDPPSAEVAKLVESCRAARRCHVILSAAVPTAALRALAIAVATAPAVVVRPSRRDPDVARLLAAELARDPSFHEAGGSITASERASGLDALPGEALHVYGADATIRAITALVPRGVVVRGHGSGLGAAVVASGEDEERAAQEIARDVVPFDQRGCLSPRFVLVEGSPERAATFGRALASALDALGARIPRGPLDALTAAAIAMHRATMQAVGAWLEGGSYGVGVDPDPRALILAPAARVVHVVSAGDRALSRLLDPWARFITTLGAADSATPFARAASARAPNARRAHLGAMQRPPFDGPVDLRTVGAAEIRADGPVNPKDRVRDQGGTG